MFIPRRDAAVPAAVPAAPAVAVEGQAPFLAEPPPFWKPQTVHEPAAWELPNAPALPKEALRAGALPLPAHHCRMLVLPVLPPLPTLLPVYSVLSLQVWEQGGSYEVSQRTSACACSSHPQMRPSS